MTFAACAICGANDWGDVYVGSVRDGVFGRTRLGARVCRCGNCGVERLDEDVCPDDAFYETPAYREKLQQELTAAAHQAVADELQIFTQQILWPTSLRGTVVADIGCAGGSFLDHVAGLADKAVAIEPCSIYHESLRSRGYTVFPYAKDACRELAGKVDLAVSIQVIEHVLNPREFLEDIRPLLAPGGRLLISTPNRADILMHLLPQDFPEFFYRVVHRWYFDEPSLRRCAVGAGYKVQRARFVHRYGMANALAWLRDRRPTGQKRIDVIDPMMDKLWAGYLESAGMADCLFMELSLESAEPITA